MTLRTKMDSVFDTRAETAFGSARLRQIGWVATAAIAFVIGLVYLFWPAAATGLDRLPGDLGDFRFINVVIEHWYRVFVGKSPWRETLFFFPQPGVLGYSDALFLYAVPYAAFRVARISPYYAFFWTLVTMMCIAFSSTLWLFRRVWQIAWPIAIAASVLFTFSNSAALKIVHPNLYAVAFVPLAIGLLWRVVAAVHDGKPFGRSGTLLAVLVPLLMYTSYYIGWLLVFLCLVWGLVLVVQKFCCARDDLRGFLVHVREVRYRLFGLCAIFLLALVPFVITHLQPFLDHGGRSWQEVRTMLPSPGDYLNVGAGNPAWSWLAAAIAPADRPMAHELTLGFPPGLMVAFAIVAGLVLARMIAFCRRKDGSISLRDQSLACLAGTVPLCWLLMLKVDDHSLWSLVYAAVPGAGTIRAVFRLQLLLHLAVLAIVAAALNMAWRAGRYRAAILIVLGLLVAEQVNLFRTSYDARREASWLANLQAPPASCRFFAIAPDGARYTGYSFGVQLDAMMMAERLGIPTINGYSSIFPAHWRGGLLDLRSADYAASAMYWLRRHGLREGFCLHNLRTGSWWTPRAAGTDLRHVNLVRREATSFEDALALELKGFHGLEPVARWTDGAAAIILANPISAQRITLDADILDPAGSRLRIAADGETLFDRVLPVGPVHLEFPRQGSVAKIEIESTAFVPKVIGMNADVRQLGVAVKNLTID